MTADAGTDSPGIKKPVLLVACFGSDIAPWIEPLERHGAGLEIRIWPDAGAAAEIDYVLAWNVPEGFWAPFVALKAVLSIGAGVDRLLQDPGIRPELPVVRMEDPSLEKSMVEYVVLQVLRHHRDLPRYEADQRRGLWRPVRPPLAAHRTVGILGLGRLGLACAEPLAALGFVVAGWSRGPKAASSVPHYAGQDQLDAFLARSEILVCTLALTPQTAGILDRSLFARLPRGAFVINVGRGGHLNEDDLIPALDQGLLSGAALDVMAHEPLPPGHPFWSDPRILITPHIAGFTYPETAAQVVVRNIARLEASQPVQGLIDRGKGY